MRTRKNVWVWNCVLLAVVPGLSGLVSAQVIPSAEPRAQIAAAPSASTGSPALYGTVSSRSRSSGRRGRGGDASPDPYGSSTALPRQLPAAASANAVLLVPSGQSARGDLVALAEDLNVMCRVFDKLLDQAGLRPSNQRSISGYFLSGDDGRWLGQMFGDQSGRTECLYVEGYGPLFVMSVDFPLLPPPAEEPRTEPNEPADPLWNQVRQETYAPQTARRGGERDPRIEYSPLKVQQLKETLIRTVKHATNIRAVEQSAWLTVVVKGVGGGAPSTSVQWTLGPQSRWVPRGGLVGEAAPPTAPTSRLTLRARMQDIQALASRQLSDDEFRKRIEVIEY